VRLSPGFAALTRIPEIERHADWIAEMAPAAIIAGEEVVPPFPPA
jgi:hypothetical protein